MSKLYSNIIKASLLAGTLDITAACTSYYIRTGKPPGGVFKFIASGAFGNAAFTGGTEIIIAGILFHYLIAFAFTIAFFVLYARTKQWLSRYIVVSGLAYGLIAWCIMNLAVVPLSRTPVIKTIPSQVFIGMLFLMFLIGLPVALFAKRQYPMHRRR